MRKIVNFNLKWAFSKLAAAVPEAMPDKWDWVTLPHTWNNIDGQDGGADYYPMVHFMDAILNDKTPLMDVYLAVETAAPAIAAAESANKGGIQIEIPDFRV